MAMIAPANVAAAQNDRGLIDEGRIVAEGTHRELLESSTVYREIYDSQLGEGFEALNGNGVVEGAGDDAAIH